MLEEQNFAPADDDAAVAAITSLIKIDKAESITATKQTDKSWLIKAMVPKKP